MKKKIISAILLGLFIGVPTSTFVSCSDYDDDISSLQNQIEDLQSALDAVKSQIAAGSLLTDVSSTTNGVKLTLSNGQSYTITNGKDGADGTNGTNGTNGTDGKDGSVVTIGDNGNWFIDGIDTGLAAQGEKGDKGDTGETGAQGEKGDKGDTGETGAQGEKGDKGDTGDYYYPNADGYFHKVDASGNDTKTDIEWKDSNDKIYAVWTDSELRLYNVPDENGNIREDAIVISLKSKLKSLVFSPAEYYNGIEALKVYSFQYEAIVSGLAKADLTKNQTTDGKYLEYDELPTYIAPECVADYYLNPSNADMSTDKSHYSFDVQNLEYTRAASKAALTVNSVEVSGGKASVHFNVTGTLTSIASDSKVDVAALQYTYKSAATSVDTVVTSDFAALHKFVVKDFIINKGTAANVDGSTTPHANHLALTATEALTSSVYLEIPYNKSEGLNLDEWIDVHYNVDGNADKYWGYQEDINEQHFSLQYELIGYISGDNKTNESGHATIDGNMLYVHAYGNTDSSSATKAIIGRTPLIRVKLIDNNTNDQVAAVGYILVKITDAYTDSLSCEADAVTSAYTLACATGCPSAFSEKVMTWDQIEDSVLAKLNISKATFENNYELEEDKQYQLKNKQFVELTPTIGTVKTTTSDMGGHQTNVLHWTIDQNTAYNNFVTKKQTSLSTWVRFVGKGSDSALTPFYIKLTWTPSKINATPSVAFKDSDDKSASDWHATGSRSAGYAEVHMQVGAPTSTDVCAFNQLVLDNCYKTVNGVKHNPAWRVQTDLKAGGYTCLADNVTTTYSFAPKKDQLKQTYKVGNTTYRVYVTEDGLTIKAGTGYNYKTYSDLATIDPTDGKIEVANNDVVNALINAPEWGKEITDALTFTIAINVEACPPAEDMVTVSNNTFNVRVIKPLFIENISVNPMKLNEGTSLTQDVLVNFKDFVGYNPVQFFNSETADKQGSVTEDFFEFYQIKPEEMEVDVDNITTNYTGVVAKVDEDKFKVEYTAADPVTYDYDEATKTGTGNPYIGKVTLTQVNMSRANSFEIYLPVKVTYACGTLTGTITVKVEASEGGQSAKKY